MLNSKRQRGLKISGICGILSPTVAFGCILLSITFAPDFSWTDNALSDLGVMPNPTAILFNSGLIISGILAMVFASGLFSVLKGKSTGRAGTILFLLDCLALTAIGVFPENTRPMHFYASVAFFALFPLSMLLITAYFVLASRNRMAVFTFLVSVFAAAVWIVEFWVRYVPGVAIPETLSAIAASFWAVVTSFIMLRAASRSHK
jgi:hypothetical membrane protein